MARRRTRAPRAAPRGRSPEPLNWPLAIGVTGLVGGAVYYFTKIRPAAAQAAALQTILPGPAPLPPQSTVNPQPVIPPPPPPSQTLPPVPAGAARATIPASTIGAIQASLNLLGGCGCRTLVVNGVWNPDTEDAWRCYLRKLNASMGRPLDVAAQVDQLTPANADQFLVGLQTALPRIVNSVAGCTTP